jgi:hypothetical protein
MTIRQTSRSVARGIALCALDVVVTLVVAVHVFGTDGQTKAWAASDYATAADNAAKQELQTAEWVRDLYVSPGVMNVGVLRGEKDWRSPMIGHWVCAVLVKHGSDLVRVRFVDIEQVAYAHKSVREAEISTTDCR